MLLKSSNPGNSINPKKVRLVIAFAFSLILLFGGSIRTVHAAGNATPAAGFTPDQWRDGFKEGDYSNDQLRDIYRDPSQPLERRQGACQAFGGSDCSNETLDMVAEQPREISDGQTG